MFEERTRVLSIICPFARKDFLPETGRALACRSRRPRRLPLGIQPRDAPARAGQFEGENFHFVVIPRCVSDLVSNEIQCALCGIKSGNLSAHSITEIPSPKKYSSSPRRSAADWSSIRKKSK